MSKRDLTYQNAKEATYYGVMMVVSFLAYFVINRVMQSSNDLPQFLSGFAVALFIVSSVFTMIKYFKSNKDSQNPSRNAAKVFTIIAVLLWITLIVTISK